MGRISKAGHDWSTVLTVIDTDTSLGARVYRTKDIGIAGGKDKIKLKTSGNVARVTRDIFRVTGEGDQVATITWTVEPGAHTA